MTADDRSIANHLFVYGTLQPGAARWHLLSPVVVEAGRPDTAAGRLYDTRRDYPAAIFDGEGTIAGLTYRLLDHSIDQALAALDEEEGTVAGLYRRVTITTGAGVVAWAYEYGGGLELTPIPSGDWNRR